MQAHEALPSAFLLASSFKSEGDSVTTRCRDTKMFVVIVRVLRRETSDFATVAAAVVGAGCTLFILIQAIIILIVILLIFPSPIRIESESEGVVVASI